MMKVSIDSLTVLHDVSNALEGSSIILNQLIAGVYGNTIEETKTILLSVNETNNKIAYLMNSQLFQQLDGTVQQLKPNGVIQFDLLDFLLNTAQKFLPLAQFHSLNLHTQTSANYLHGTTVIGDVVHLERMLSNLVENAIRYTRPSGDIFLRLLNQGDDLLIEVEDTGIGIKDEDMPTIFVPLLRSLCLNPYVPRRGCGMGLYIALMIAKAHGLKLSVESVVGKGTLFTITFPYKPNNPYGLDVSMAISN